MGNIIDTNPDPSIFVEIAKYSNYFSKSFEEDYLYFILYYNDGNTHASNFMYWQNILNGFALTTTENTIEIIYQSGDAYNYYSTALGGGNFNYDAGHDSIAHKFTFDLRTNVITLYNGDSSIRWTSPAGLGLATNAFAIDVASNWQMTDNGLVNALIPQTKYVGAFADCASLRRVSIPPTVKKIGNHAFSGTALSDVTIASDCEYAPTSFPEGCIINFY